MKEDSMDMENTIRQAIDDLKASLKFLQEDFKTYIELRDEHDKENGV